MRGWLLPAVRETPPLSDIQLMTGSNQYTFARFFFLLHQHCEPQKSLALLLNTEIFNSKYQWKYKTKSSFQSKWEGILCVCAWQVVSTRCPASSGPSLGFQKCKCTPLYRSDQTVHFLGHWFRIWLWNEFSVHTNFNFKFRETPVCQMICIHLEYPMGHSDGDKSWNSYVDSDLLEFRWNHF